MHHSKKVEMRECLNILEKNTEDTWLKSKSKKVIQGGKKSVAKNFIGIGQENTKELKKKEKSRRRTEITKFYYHFVLLATICQHNTILVF